MPAGEAEPASLADRDELDGVDLADLAAVGVDDAARASASVRAPTKPARPSPRRMKQTSWLSGLRRGAQAEGSAARARTSALVMAPIGKRTRRQLRLAEHADDVALVLRRVRAPADPQRAVGAVDDAGVVPGGDGVEAELVGPAQERVELDVAVALDARVRRAAGGVGGDVGLDDRRRRTRGRG